MHVRWGNTTTTLFPVTNGVKQGGILSPMLFNVYMDVLISPVLVEILVVI